GLKEVLYETLGAPDRAASQRLGMASFRLLHHVAERLLEAGAGAVIESNFRRGISEPDLARLIAGHRAALVHCEGNPGTIVRRCRERAERGQRHPGHHDLQVVSLVRQDLAAGVYALLALDIPLLRVDTTTATEYVPGFDEIVSFLTRLAQPPSA
ncbi:MAG TPA: hypothetical protein VJ794_01645, partial [Gemmatimonadales bacterium]|nr:hypothetical protein [Gemmatimonadales bacterium]